MKLLSAALILSAVSMIVACGGGGPTTYSGPAMESTATPDAAPAPAPTHQITLANFMSIKNGMTYNEVTEKLNDNGELMSESEIADIKTAMVTWKVPSGMGNMNVMFQNGRVISKAQFGLK